jgi:hypothetical protein
LSAENLRGGIWYPKGNEKKLWDRNKEVVGDKTEANIRAKAKTTGVKRNTRKKGGPKQGQNSAKNEEKEEINEAQLFTEQGNSEDTRLTKKKRRKPAAKNIDLLFENPASERNVEKTEFIVKTNDETENATPAFY